MAGIGVYNGKILEHRHLNDYYSLLTIEVPEIAMYAKPGQFVMVACREQGSLDPLLRRPLSLHNILADDGQIQLLYQLRGKGTTWLWQRRPGETLSMLGPLGRGFRLPPEVNKAVLVGGGIGNAPLLPIAQVLAQFELESRLFTGARSEAHLVGVEPIAALGIPVHISTEDGSVGRQGLVTEELAVYLERERPDYLYACGPLPMLKAVVKLARQYGLAGQVSLEETMACGTGICLGCDCGGKKVCKEGPVFAIEEVVLND
ncbi:MAG: dihydroorotate dehydrogenase electron transfer subunit [Bacillota bacterium]